MSKFFATFLPQKEKKFRKKVTGKSTEKDKPFYRKKKFWLIFAGLILLIGFVFAYKTGRTLNKISDKDNTILGSLWGALGGGGVDEDDGRTNVLLLGMRGQNVPGGGLLADSIMVISLKKDENKVAMISVPRDLYVKVPGENYHTKINAVYAHGEEGWKKKGLEEMKQVIGEVTGLKIHYGVVINFNGFRQLIDAVGGVPITLSTPFYETTQFVDGNECGGEFTLPQGTSTLNGEQALCYVRARMNTSDFDRAKRQQVLLQSLRDKLISMGTLTDFNKLNKILDAIGENVRTDMSTREMRELYDEYGTLSDAKIYRRVFENSPEGFLMVPQDAPANVGYILIPRSGYDNYSEINDVCRDIFNLPEQSDIDPAKQFVKPKGKEKSEEKDEKNKEKKSDTPSRGNNESRKIIDRKQKVAEEKTGNKFDSKNDKKEDNKKSANKETTSEKQKR